MSTVQILNRELSPPQMRATSPEWRSSSMRVPMSIVLMVMGDPATLGASGGHTSTVGVLLRWGASVNATGNDGRTPLHWAAWKVLYGGVAPPVGASVNATGNDGRTPLHWAAWKGNTSTVGAPRGAPAPPTGATPRCTPQGGYLHGGGASSGGASVNAPPSGGKPRCTLPPRGVTPLWWRCSSGGRLPPPTGGATPRCTWPSGR